MSRQAITEWKQKYWRNRDIPGAFGSAMEWNRQWLNCCRWQTLTLDLFVLNNMSKFMHLIQHLIHSISATTVMSSFKKVKSKAVELRTPRQIVCRKTKPLLCSHFTLNLIAIRDITDGWVTHWRLLTLNDPNRRIRSD